MQKEKIGKLFRSKRKSLHITQEELAEKTDIHEKQISRIESGKHYPTLENFMKLTEALGMKLADFDEYSKELSTAETRNELMFIIKSASDDEVMFYRKMTKVIHNHRV